MGEHSNIIARWLADAKPTSQRNISFGANFIDLTRTTGRLIGTAAIRFNNTILTVTDLRGTDVLRGVDVNLRQDLHILGPKYGYEVIDIGNRRMQSLRGAIGHGTQMARAFRKALGEHLEGRFPKLDHEDSLVNEARYKNALQYRGRKTHVMIADYTSTNGARTYVISGYYESAEEAMLVLFKNENPERYRMVEIGGYE